MTHDSQGNAATLPEESNKFRVLSELVGDAMSVIAVTGELDIATVPAFRAALTEAAESGITRLVVDLSRVTFVDSVGVGAILHTKQRLGATARMAVVVPTQSYAGVIFDVGGADAIVDVYEARAAAVAHVTA